jgi:hypothetical protein
MTTPAREAIMALLEAPDMATAEGMLATLLRNAAETARRGIGANMPPEETPLEAPADPEHLLRVTAADLGALVEKQYAPLWARNAEIKRDAKAWLADHDGGSKPIADDTENNALSDQMRQLDDHVKEIEEARKKVSEPLHAAWKAAIAAFAPLADPLQAIRGVGRQPPANTMQFMQTAYLVAKARREQAERERIAREAEEEAARKEAEARRAQEEEDARIAQLKAAGVREDDATTAIMGQTDRLMVEAAEADANAAAIAQAAAAPIRDFVRQRSAVGTTTSLQGQWDAVLTDIRALCRAVANGKAPVTFVMADMGAIRQAVRRRQDPVRECAGLTIAQTFAARRSGP